MPAAIMVMAVGLPQPAISGIDLWSLGRPDLTGVGAAIAVGATAWFIAALAARRRSGAARVDAAFLAVLGSVLLLPLPSVALVLPLALSLERGDRHAAMLIGLALIAAVGGMPAIAVPAIFATTMLALRAFLRGAANDNMFLLPIPYLPWLPLSGAPTRATR